MGKISIIRDDGSMEEFDRDSVEGKAYLDDFIGRVREKTDSQFKRLGEANTVEEKREAFNDIMEHESWLGASDERLKLMDRIAEEI